MTEYDHAAACRARRERLKAAGVCITCGRAPIAPWSRSRCVVCLHRVLGSVLRTRRAPKRIAS